MLHHTAAIGVHPGGAIDHQVRDRRVEQEFAQLFGKERQYQLVAHRGPPDVGVALILELRTAIPGATGSTETRFSWNSVIVKPSGLMVSNCGKTFAWSLTCFGFR